MDSFVCFSNCKNIQTQSILPDESIKFDHQVALRWRVSSRKHTLICRIKLHLGSIIAMKRPLCYHSNTIIKQKAHSVEFQSCFTQDRRYVQLQIRSLTSKWSNSVAIFHAKLVWWFHDWDTSLDQTFDLQGNCEIQMIIVRSYFPIARIWPFCSIRVQTLNFRGVHFPKIQIHTFDCTHKWFSLPEETNSN